MIFNDANDKLRSKIPSLVDGSNDTCLDLPVLGQTPPILWMRMNISGIWGLFSSGFRLSVFGNNINCDNQNEDSVLRVMFIFQQYYYTNIKVYNDIWIFNCNFLIFPIIYIKILRQIIEMKKKLFSFDRSIFFSFSCITCTFKDSA